MGPQLIRNQRNQDGSVKVEKVEVHTSALRGVVGVYFSAHWCGPCRNFTPQLRKVYERVRSKGRAFEVVFASSDRDEASFQEYFATMPWHALPFSDRGRQHYLSTLFQVRGIPSLVLLDAYTGRVLDQSARGKVMEPGFISTLPRVIDLEVAHLPEPGDTVPIVICYQGKKFELDCEPGFLEKMWAIFCLSFVLKSAKVLRGDRNLSSVGRNDKVGILMNLTSVCRVCRLLGEGWEMLRMQIYSMTEVPAEQMKLFGLGLDKGGLSESSTLKSQKLRDKCKVF